MINSLDEEKMTPLMWASFYGNSENVVYLLKMKADPFLKDIEGKTGKYAGVLKKKILILCQHYIGLPQISIMSAALL